MNILKNVINKKIEMFQNILDKIDSIDILKYMDNSLSFSLKNIQRRQSATTLFEHPYSPISLKGRTQEQLKYSKYDKGWVVKSDLKKRGRKKKNEITIESECCKVCYGSASSELAVNSELVNCLVCGETYHRNCILGELNYEGMLGDHKRFRVDINKGNSLLFDIDFSTKRRLSNL